MILPNGELCSMNPRETLRNNNCLIIASPGAGKTRNFIIPNLLESECSQVVLDPKGSIYEKCSDILRHKGFKVKKLSFKDPKHSMYYNPMKNIKTTSDIHKLAYLLADKSEAKGRSVDLFWPQSESLLFEVLLAYEIEVSSLERREPNMMNLLNILEESGKYDGKNPLSELFEVLHCRRHDSYAYKQYLLFNSIAGSNKTMCTIMMTCIAALKDFYSDELGQMMCKDNLGLERLGKEKTILFIEVDDIDRSYDKIINIFFTQLLTVLINTADNNKDHELLVPVRIILDDFCSILKIDNFSNILSNCRSRGICIWMAIQSLQQLELKYPMSESIIVDNADTLVFMGGNCPETASYIGKRLSKQRCDLLAMPIGSSYIMQRGQKSIYVSQNMTLIQYLQNNGLEEVNEVIKTNQKKKEEKKNFLGPQV